MAEETKTETMPEDGPWNSSWQDLAKQAGTYVEDAVSSVKSAVSSAVNKLPWEKTADELSQEAGYAQARIDATNKALQTPQQAPMGFQSLFNRLVDTESAGQHTNASGALLTSSKGAKGITQVMDATAKDPGFGVTPIQNNSAEEYLRFGKDYLTALIKNFNGDQTKAVAAYNAGPAAVQRAVAKANKKGGDWLSYAPLETQKYVKRIIG